VGVPSFGGGPEQLVLFLVLRGSKQAQQQQAQTPASLQRPAELALPPPSAAAANKDAQDEQVAAAAAAAAAMSKDLHRACQAAIRAHMSPLFRVAKLYVRALLPRNASNKVMRRVLRDEVVASTRSRL